MTSTFLLSSVPVARSGKDDLLNINGQRHEMKISRRGSTAQLTYENDLLDLSPDLRGIACEEGVGAAASTAEHPTALSWDRSRDKRL